MKINIGKNTLGDSNKMSVNLREYGRSTHDISYAWRSSMGVGTLVPFMKILALPGDSFDINLENKIMTHPTIGPLFGSYKFQADVFTCPIRLYNAMLHNNALNIGMDMSKVKLPKFVSRCGFNDARKGVMAYLGWQGQNVKAKDNKYNVVPLLAYYDIFKNYYANKQEEYFYVMGGYKENVNEVRIEADTEISELRVKRYDNGGTMYVNITGWSTLRSNARIEDGEYEINIVYPSSGSKYKIKLPLRFREQEGIYYVYDVINIREPLKNIEVTPKFPETPGDFVYKYEETIIKSGDVVPSLTGRHRLGVLDDLREYILSKGHEEVVFGKRDEKNEGYKFITEIVNGASDNKSPIIKGELGGLCLKTHLSDIYNNWINKEWIEGDNGISAITAIDTSSGSFSIDTLNLAQKVYNLLNRIAISGGTYKDWIETVYTTDYYFRAETPIYEGGLSSEIEFSEVVSNSASGASGIEEPLGTLAGKGFNSSKKGGSLKIKVNEPCYLIGIASITPRVDYPRGNEWDLYLDTMDDLRKPQLDGIGYQDLMGVNMLEDVYPKTIAYGKQPAWINYMTNVNKTYGNFKDGESESFMVLNRIFESDFEEGKKETGIKGYTTYISPKDYSYIFATTENTDQHFWVQIGCGIKARRVGSAKQIPLM